MENGRLDGGNYDTDDLVSWHYLVEVSEIDMLLMPDEYLYSEDDLRDIIKKYS